MDDSEFEHRARKRIKDVKKRARPGMDITCKFLIFSRKN